MRKGQHHSVEAKFKLAKAHIGKKLTDEHKRKISIGGKGRKFTPEHKKKIGAANKGKSRSLEVRLRLSEKLKGNKNNLGRHLSLETKKKISEARKGKHNRYPFTTEHRRKLAVSKIGNKNPAWKGGKTMTGPNGYCYLLCPDHPFATARGYVKEHRLIMEAHLGRTLLPAEVVHHINGNLSDNRIENLMLFSSQSKHLSHHRKKKS